MSTLFMLLPKTFWKKTNTSEVSDKKKLTLNKLKANSHSYSPITKVTKICMEKRVLTSDEKGSSRYIKLLQKNENIFVVDSTLDICSGSFSLLFQTRKYQEYQDREDS